MVITRMPECPCCEDDERTYISVRCCPVPVPSVLSVYVESPNSPSPSIPCLNGVTVTLTSAGTGTWLGTLDLEDDGNAPCGCDPGGGQPRGAGRLHVTLSCVLVGALGYYWELSGGVTYPAVVGGTCPDPRFDVIKDEADSCDPFLLTMAAALFDGVGPTSYGDLTFRIT